MEMLRRFPRLCPDKRCFLVESRRVRGYWLVFWRREEYEALWLYIASYDDGFLVEDRY